MTYAKATSDGAVQIGPLEYATAQVELCRAMQTPRFQVLALAEAVTALLSAVEALQEVE